MAEGARTYDSAFLAEVRRLLDLRGYPTVLDEVTGPVLVIDATHLLTSDLKSAAPSAQAATELNLTSSDLFAHGGSRTSGAGGAGQFSGVLDLYAGIVDNPGLTKIQLVGFWARPSVAAILRTYYWDISGVRNTGVGDLLNIATGLAPARLGFLDFLSQTATPDTVSPPQWGTPLRMAFIPLLANTLYTWPLETGVALVSRNTNAQALGWGVWASATVTAITVDYGVIVRQVPTP